ncbi:MAG: winged helix-turn-helix transcriptional regulator [Thermoplasmata archaeon]|nr:MAG: winged helix-turn-helix transcriptional regulator [Thermoplasmata archaeon]
MNMKLLANLLFLSCCFSLLFVLTAPPAAGQQETDLHLSGDDIYLSKLNPGPAEDVVIYTVIGNSGPRASATVRFYSGEFDEPIGEDRITVDSGASSVASAVFQPSIGPMNILVRIEESDPCDIDLGNNQAISHVVFYSGESPLELIPAEATFEGGIERVIPISVEPNSDMMHVNLTVIYHGDVDVELLSPPLNLEAGKTATFFVKVRVPVLKENEILSNRSILLRASNNDHESNIAELRITMHPSVEQSSWWSPTVAVAAGTLGLFAVVGSTEVGKYKFISFVGPLYTKLHRDEILDHYLRGKIHGYILANPGEHYNSIRKALDIPNGCFTYHLRVLEREGLIKSKRDGIYRRFYPYGALIPDNGNNPRVSDTQKIIIDNIRASPGISQKEIALLLGASRSTINYHINKLSKEGIVRVERRGMGVRYYLKVTEDNQELVHFIKLPLCQ